MGERYDLARMLREIAEETTSRSGQSRALTQEEIKRLVAEKGAKAEKNRTGASEAPSARP